MARRTDPTREDRSAPQDGEGPDERVELASALRLSVMRLARRLRHERVSTDLSIAQMAALATLHRNGGKLTPGELAAKERVQPPSMTRTVSVLAERGLVVRQPHPTDGRQSVLSLSDAGRELLLADRRRRDAWLACRLSDLTPADMAALAAAAPILERLANDS